MGLKRYHYLKTGEKSCRLDVIRKRDNPVSARQLNVLRTRTRASFGATLTPKKIGASGSTKERAFYPLYLEFLWLFKMDSMANWIWHHGIFRSNRVFFLNASLTWCKSWKKITMKTSIDHIDLTKTSLVKSDQNKCSDFRVRQLKRTKNWFAKINVPSF